MDKDTLRLKIGKKVKDLRKSNKDSQETLAEKLGCGKERISKLERGKIAFAEDLLIGIANLYNEDVSYFYNFYELSEDKQNIINQINSVLAGFSLSKLKKTLDIMKIAK